ncbi:MAG: Uncharacterised protein [Prochlorococcus marinus str. MIT 9215]|nr:MAG: Uncharacterised protein [Prochlorococcus marinus str. MIT 9215]
MPAYSAIVVINDLASVLLPFETGSSAGELII